jgi:hypothetical protein
MEIYGNPKTGKTAYLNIQTRLITWLGATGKAFSTVAQARKWLEKHGYVLIT